MRSAASSPSSHRTYKPVSKPPGPTPPSGTVQGDSNVVVVAESVNRPGERERDGVADVRSNGSGGEREGIVWAHLDVDIRRQCDRGERKGKGDDRLEKHDLLYSTFNSTQRLGEHLGHTHAY